MHAPGLLEFRPLKMGQDYWSRENRVLARITEGERKYVLVKNGVYWHHCDFTAKNLLINFLPWL
jgi:hypothetical protein